MISEKDRVNSLKEKIIQYETELDEKSSLIAQYQTVEKAADNKIKAINTIHAEKIRSLMNSISLLKKEAMSLKKASQEHKRSELITSLNKEIADQDLIIETLRTLLPNEEAADKEIVKVLTKGPPKIRVETREELKMEIKKMKAQITKLTVKKDNNNTNDINNKENRTNLDDRRNSFDTQLSIKTEFNENFFQQLDEMKNQNEDLRLNLKAQQVVIQRYEEDNNDKIQELNDLRLIKTDYLVLTKKYETLQKENEKIRETNNKKFVLTYDKEMRLDELEILHKTQQGKMNLVEKNVGFELNNYKQRLDDLDEKNNVIQLENDKIIIKNNELLQKNKLLTQTNKKNKEEFETFKKEKELFDKKNETLIANLHNSIDKIELERNHFENENIQLNNTLYLLKADLRQLQNENQELKIHTLEIKEKFKNLPQESSLQDLPQTPILENLQPQLQTSFIMPKNNKSNIISTEVLEENKILKKKLKEHTIRQIEITEKIEALELEKRFRSKKESLAFIKARQNERQTQKIQNLQEKLRDLELKNKNTFLRLDSNLSQGFKNIELDKLSKMEIDSNLSYSMSISKMNSKISTPLKSDRLIETDSDISTENQELKKILKQKQEEDLNLKIKMNGLEKEINKGKVQKKDVITIENEKKIKELAEKISYISSENSDISKQYSLIGSSFLDSNLSNMEMDSNIESIVSLKENIDTDSNISSYMRK